jgi:hypothetical protein
MPSDVFLDDERNLIADRSSFSDTPPYVAGCDLDERYRDEYDPIACCRYASKYGLEINLDPRAQSDPEKCQLGDAIRLVPGRKIMERVFTHQKNEFRIGILSAQQGEAVDGIAGTGAANIDVGDREMRVPLQSELEHREPVSDRGDGPPDLVRWLPGWQEEDTGELEFLLEHLSDDQVPMMDRVERSAEDPEP